MEAKMDPRGGRQPVSQELRFIEGLSPRSKELFREFGTADSDVIADFLRREEKADRKKLSECATKLGQLQTLFETLELDIENIGFGGSSSDYSSSTDIGDLLEIQHTLHRQYNALIERKKQRRMLLDEMEVRKADCILKAEEQKKELAKLDKHRYLSVRVEHQRKEMKLLDMKKKLEEEERWRKHQEEARHIPRRSKSSCSERSPTHSRPTSRNQTFVSESSSPRSKRPQSQGQPIQKPQNTISTQPTQNPNQSQAGSIRFNLPTSTTPIPKEAKLSPLHSPVPQKELKQAFAQVVGAQDSSAKASEQVVPSVSTVVAAVASRRKTRPLNEYFRTRPKREGFGLSESLHLPALELKLNEPEKGTKDGSLKKQTEKATKRAQSCEKVQAMYENAIQRKNAAKELLELNPTSEMILVDHNVTKFIPREVLRMTVDDMLQNA